MAQPENTIIVACPTCSTKYKIAETLTGKRMPCKNCGNVIDLIRKKAKIKYPIIGQIALDSKLINEDQLKVAISLFSDELKSGKKIALEDIFIEKKMISPENIKKLLMVVNRKLDSRFGNIAIKKGLLSKEGVDIALAEQEKAYKETGVCRLIGDILVDSGKLTKEEQNTILGEQKRINIVEPLYKKQPNKEQSDIQAESRLQTSSENTDKKVLYPNLGRVAVDHKLIDDKQLQEVQAFQKEELNKGNKIALRDILIEKEMVSSKIMEKLIVATTRQLDKEFGQIAVKSKLISKEQYEQAMVKQANEFKETHHCRIIGDILIEDNILTPVQKDAILIRQKRLSAAESEKEPDQKTPGEDLPKENQIDKEDGPEDKSKIGGDKLLSMGEKNFWHLRKQDKGFCDSAIEKRFVIQEEVDAALEKQIKLFEETKLRKNIGDILVEDGYLTSQQQEMILAEQQRIESKETKKDDSENTICEEVTIQEKWKFELSVDKEKTKAYLKLIEKGEDIPITAEDIKGLLKEKDIIYGIVEDALISGFLKFKGRQTEEFLIASGKEAIWGRNGSIKYFFDTEPLKVGAIGSDGDIDFKNRGEIPFVKEGELLAEKIPAIEGEDGVSIYGKPIRIPELKDVKLKSETGVKRSEDDLKAYASASGQPKLSMRGVITVLSDLKVKGDVAFETGHIDFHGNVIVQGAIQSGFKVKGGNVKAKEIIGGEIDANGDVTISSGVTDSTIKAFGNVTVKYLKNSKITAYGDVAVEREIIESTIINSGSCSIKRGTVIASNISSRRGIEVKDMGTKMSNPCKLKVGVDAHGNKEIAEIEDKIKLQVEKAEKLENNQKKLEKREQQIHVEIAEKAQEQDKSVVQQRQIKEQMDTLKENGEEEQIAKVESTLKSLEITARKADEDVNKLFEEQDELMQKQLDIQTLIEEEKEELDALEEEKHTIDKKLQEIERVPVVTVSGKIFEGTTIFGPNSTLILKKDMNNIQIKEIRSSEPDSESDYEMITAHRRK